MSLEHGRSSSTGAAKDKYVFGYHGYTTYFPERSIHIIAGNAGIYDISLKRQLIGILKIFSVPKSEVPFSINWTSLSHQLAWKRCEGCTPSSVQDDALQWQKVAAPLKNERHLYNYEIDFKGLKFR